MPRLWEIIYAGKAVGEALESAAESQQQRREAVTRREEILVELATNYAKKWAVIEDLIRSVQNLNFSGEDVHQLRQIAREERLDSLAKTSLNRLGDKKPDVYGPAFDILREMDDIQPSIFEDILTACNSNDPAALDSALSSALYCQSLSEKLILLIPDLAQERRERKRADSASKKKDWIFITAAFTAVFLVLIITCSIVDATS